MRRINALIVYLFLVSAIMIVSLMAVLAVSFGVGIFESNAVVVLLFVVVCAVLAAASLFMTFYYMRVLVTSIGVSGDKIQIAVFLKLADFDLQEVDFIDLNFGRYRIVAKNKAKFTVFIRLLDNSSLLALLECIEKTGGFDKEK